MISNAEDKNAMVGFTPDTATLCSAKSSSSELNASPSSVAAAADISLAIAIQNFNQTECMTFASQVCAPLSAAVLRPLAVCALALDAVGGRPGLFFGGIFGVAVCASTVFLHVSPVYG